MSSDDELETFDELVEEYLASDDMSKWCVGMDLRVEPDIEKLADELVAAGVK